MTFNLFKWIVRFASKISILRDMSDDWDEPESEPNDLMVFALAAAFIPLVLFGLALAVFVLVEMVGTQIVPSWVSRGWLALCMPIAIAGIFAHWELGVLNFLIERGVGHLPLLTAGDYLRKKSSFLLSSLSIVILVPAILFTRWF